jgi:hypothetical protein
VLRQRKDGINAGGGWRDPGPCGIDKVNSPSATIKSPSATIKRVRLWPTIIWRPIQESSGWTLDETPDLDGLMVPLGGHRDIATMWTTFQVFPDNPSIVSVLPTARPRGLFGPRKIGTAIRVFGKATGQPTYLRAVNARGVERSRLVIRVKKAHWWGLKLWFLHDSTGKISKRTTKEALGALAKANQIFEVQANVSFTNFNNPPVRNLTSPGLQKVPVGSALNWSARSGDVHDALVKSDPTRGAFILAHVIWINRLEGVEGEDEGASTFPKLNPIIILVNDRALPEILGEVLAHELGHALLDKHSAALGYDNGHSTNNQDLMFPTAERHGRIRLRLDEVQFINPLR